MFNVSTVVTNRSAGKGGGGGEKHLLGKASYSCDPEMSDWFRCNFSMSKQFGTVTFCSHKTFSSIEYRHNNRIDSNIFSFQLHQIFAKPNWYHCTSNICRHGAKKDQVTRAEGNTLEVFIYISNLLWWIGWFSVKLVRQPSRSAILVRKKWNGIGFQTLQQIFLNVLPSGRWSGNGL